MFRGGGSDLGFLEGGECGPVLEGEGGGLGGYPNSNSVVGGGEAGGGSHDCFGEVGNEVVSGPALAPRSSLILQTIRKEVASPALACRSPTINHLSSTLVPSQTPLGQTL